MYANFLSSPRRLLHFTLLQEVTYLMTDERTHEYGQPIGDPRFYPMGPFFIRQPNQTVFNVGRRKVVNDVSLLCIATGWPTPSYRQEWIGRPLANGGGKVGQFAGELCDSVSLL